MNIVKRDIGSIFLAPYNPRKDLTTDDKEYQKIKRSIKEFGYIQPIIVNKNTNIIIAGNQRYKVLKDLGYAEVDCVEVDVSEQEEKTLNLAMNKIDNEWDMAALKDLLQELDTGELDMDLTGFDNWEIEQLMTQFHVDEEPFDEYAEDIEDIEKSDTIVVVGEYRIKVDRAVYDDWLNKLRMDVGFDKDSIEKEIMARLQL